MLFRRKPGADAGGTDRGEHEPERPVEGAGEVAPEEARPSITGTYLTDGRSLFRIQHAITEADGLHLEEPLLELEDCATLELILCSAGALERLGLRAVSPSADRDHERPSGPEADVVERLTRSR